MQMHSKPSLPTFTMRNDLPSNYPCLYSFKAMMQGTITNTLCTFPSVFIPVLFDQVFIDAYLTMALLMAMTIVYVARSLLQVNRRFKVSRHIQQAAMMLCMWIKSRIKTNKAHYRKQHTKPTHQRRMQSCSCKRYQVYYASK
jgi:hypothetical protein